MAVTTGYKHKGNARKQRSKRQPTPPYEVSDLQSKLRAYVMAVGVVLAFDFGIYNSLALNNAVRGSGLVKLQSLLTVLISVSPFCVFKLTDVKQVLTNLAMEVEGLWPGKVPVDRWASRLSERILCISNHLRRLKNSTVRFRQAVSNLTDQDTLVLKELVSLLDGTTAVTADADSVLKSVSTRVLKNQPTLDDDGFPNMFAENPKQDKVVCDTILPDDSVSNIKGGSDGSLLNCEPVAPSKRKPTKRLALKKPAAAAKSVAILKEPVAATSANEKKDLVLFSTYATNQSYIQVKQGGKKVLLVACSHKQSSDHQVIIKRIGEELLKMHTWTKESAVKLRNILIA